MKTGFLKTVMIMAILIGIGFSTASQAGEEGISFEPGIGVELLISPGYYNTIDDLYDGDVAGGFGWFGIGVDGMISFNQYLALVPEMDGYFNIVIVSGNKYDNETYANILFVPSLNARFSIPIKSGSLFMQAGPSFTVATGGGKPASYSGGGLGGACLLGYRFAIGMEIQGGYRYIPVEVEDQYSWRSEKTTENFGGPFLRGIYRF